jgi:transposase
MKKLNKRHKSKLQTLGHCKFVDKLKLKAKQYDNCTITEVQEQYTSKTCSSCGNLKETLNGRIYKCSSCKETLDRDDNASKNILLKYLTEKNFMFFVET